MSSSPIDTKLRNAQRLSAGRDPGVWWRILAELSRSAPSATRAWFTRLRPVRFDFGIMGVQTENAAQAEYLRGECLAHLVAAAQAVTGRLMAFEFEVAAAVTIEEVPSFQARPPTLAEFVVGPGNRFAHASILAAIEEPGETYNPLFVHGPSAIGKTHLAQAAAIVLRKKTTEKVFSFTADAWTAELVKQFEDDTRDAFHRRIWTAGALIIDDVHLLSERSRSLDELFHTINALLNDQRQIVFTADRSPAELVGFPERLIGRFGAGLVAGIDPPDVETRAAILRSKAKRLAIEVPDAVVKALVEDGPESLHVLIGFLVRLDAMSRMEAMPITVDLAHRAMDGK